MEVKSTGVDFRTATREEITAAMNRGVRAALRRHKQAGVPAIVFNHETGEIVSLPPEQIPDFPEDEDTTDGQTQSG